jgi:hypothetical protein
MPSIASSALSFYSGMRTPLGTTGLPPVARYQFENGNFAQDLNGWDVFNHQVSPGGVVTAAGINILGCPIPADPTPYPIGTKFDISIPPYGEYVSAPSPGQSKTPLVSGYSTTIVEGGPTGKYAQLEILSPAIVEERGQTLYGPAIASKTAVISEVGDRISFRWTANGGDDAFNVFAYIIDPYNGCRSFVILDRTGNSASERVDWTTETRVFQSGEAGIYHFVFVCGTFDFNFGGATGARLSVDEVKIEKAGTF